MKYCPNCEAEYEDTATVCADCGIPLVDTKPLHCPVCEERVDRPVLFCPHCGHYAGLAEEPEEFQKCETHPETEANGICIVCGKFVCDECSVDKDGKIFCNDDSHVQIHQDYALIYRTTMEYEAAMIRSNLEGAGIPARIFSQFDHAVLTGHGNLSVISVMVPKSQTK